jgi:hypothetical protein
MGLEAKSYSTINTLDVTFNEDRSRIRKEHAPENMAALRRIALNLVRQESSRQISLRQKRLLCGLDAHSALRADFENTIPFLKDRLVAQWMHTCRV